MSNVLIICSLGPDWVATSSSTIPQTAAIAPKRFKNTLGSLTRKNDHSSNKEVCMYVEVPRRTRRRRRRQRYPYPTFISRSLRRHSRPTTRSERQRPPMPLPAGRPGPLSCRSCSPCVEAAARRPVFRQQLERSRCLRPPTEQRQSHHAAICHILRLW